ncbi:T4 family baseplate hub assembly chaperone [Nocardia bovistercoris]|uniref:DUF6760 domain-containing protein n=1 Tax=Nocardia bovistercoris TaxID=2785916 RepID=A0A931I632_9NOCA|nr:DUF6760 family protein [Nocardia bovistercoris]MBH0775557.1 hypothetical protein [Nocardia bovistercoris]
MNALTGTLPGGYWDAAGVLHRTYDLVPLTGREEELLVHASDRPQAELVTEVLTRGVHRIGDIESVSAEVARGLLVGDRQLLLLRLRQATFGDLVRAALICPWADCGQRVTMEFSLAEVPVVESTAKGPVYTMRLSDAATTDTNGGAPISFRLPTGADQEQLSRWLAVDEARALTMLLDRCVGAEITLSLSSLARAEIESEMRRAAPGVEQVLEAGCAECGRTFLVPFDVARYFFGELRTDRELLYREVHYLAYHYHWSEAEIMSMTREQRRTYLEVLGDEIERSNGDA